MHAPARSATPTRRGARAVPSQIDSLSFVLEVLPLVLYLQSRIAPEQFLFFHATTRSREMTRFKTPYEEYASTFDVFPLSAASIPITEPSRSYGFGSASRRFLNEVYPKHVGRASARHSRRVARPV